MEEPVLEDVFLYSIFRARKAKLQRLQRQYQLGDSRDRGPIADSLLRSKDTSLADADRSRLMRKFMDVEIKALEDLTAGDEAAFDGIVSREAAAAGAGSGKTNTLAHRVAHLIVHGIDPGRILLLTFSRRAAADMERQAQRIVAKRDRAGVIRSPGREPSMPSAPGCYGCRRARSASTRPSPFTTARIQATSVHVRLAI